MQTTLEKQSPVGAGAGRNSIVAAAKSAGSEGPMSMLDASKRNVERHLAAIEKAQDTLGVVAKDDSKRHLVSGAEHELTMAYAELVGGVNDIFALHEKGVERRLVRSALEMIVDSDVKGKEHSNTLARTLAKVLLAQIRPSRQVGSILLSEGVTVKEAESNISTFVSEAQGIIRQIGEIKKIEDPGEKRARKLSAEHELKQSVALLAASSLEIAMLAQSGTADELVKDALDLIRKYGAHESKLAAAAMLYDVDGAISKITSLVKQAEAAITAKERTARTEMELGQTVATLAGSSLEIIMIAQSGTANELVKDALELIIEHGPDERKQLAARAMLAEMNG
jgi:hypothetical protein